MPRGIKLWLSLIAKNVLRQSPRMRCAAQNAGLRKLIRKSFAKAHGIRIGRALDPETYNKLSKSLTLMLGIDPLVVMKDIVGASREQALDALEWSARTLVKAALTKQESVEAASCKKNPRGHAGCTVGCNVDFNVSICQHYPMKFGRRCPSGAPSRVADPVS